MTVNMTAALILVMLDAVRDIKADKATISCKLEGALHFRYYNMYAVIS